MTDMIKCPCCGRMVSVKDAEAGLAKFTAECASMKADETALSFELECLRDNITVAESLITMLEIAIDESGDGEGQE